MLLFSNVLGSMLQVVLSACNGLTCRITYDNVLIKWEKCFYWINLSKQTVGTIQHAKVYT